MQQWRSKVSIGIQHVLMVFKWLSSLSLYKVILPSHELFIETFQCYVPRLVTRQSCFVLNDNRLTAFSLSLDVSYQIYRGRAGARFTIAIVHCMIKWMSVFIFCHFWTTNLKSLPHKPNIAFKIFLSILGLWQYSLRTGPCILHLIAAQRAKQQL